MALARTKIAEARRIINSLNTSVIKQAELGGGQDIPFEQAFSNLAHAYLQDKAPALQDYEIGFQLVDRNQDNTKAIGVFGFKVGSQWLYAPVFFLNGDVKGHELLYIKNQDLFVPMKENWLNYLLNRKPDQLGEGVDKNLGALGVMSPNFYQLSRSPAKYASAKTSLEDIRKLVGHLKIAEWALPVMPDLAHFATTSPLHDEKYNDMRGLLDFIKDAGSKAVYALVDTINDWPALRPYLNAAYGEIALNETIKQAMTAELDRKSVLAAYKRPLARVKSAAKLIIGDDDLDDKPSNIRIITYSQVTSSAGKGFDLSAKQKEQLLSGNVAIQDTREDKDVTSAYDIDVPTKLETVGESGLYEVLVKPFSFKKCLVIIGPYSHKRANTFATVVDVESKAWLNTHQTEVFASKQYEQEDYDKWFDNLSDGKMSGGDKLIIGPTGQGSVPFHTGDTDKGKIDSYDVYFHSFAKKDRPLSLTHDYFSLRQRPLLARPYDQYEDEFDPLQNNIKSRSRVVFTEREGRSLRSTGNELLVPKTYKILNLTKNTCGCGNDSDPAAVIDLGTAADFYMGIIKSGGLKQLTLTNSGTYGSINGNSEKHITDTLIELVYNHGLREKQARDMIETARESKSARFLVKYATQDYPLQRSAPTAPPMPEPEISMDPMTGGRVPTMREQHSEQPIPGMQSQETDRSVYDVRPESYSQPNMIGESGNGAAKPDSKSMGIAMDAAKSGQKEVFDTTMLGSMLKAVRDDSMVDKYLGDLMKGMDRLARILFTFYWHQDKFEDRYGKEDMPELEDSLRNAFEAMGDIVLFLKQKTIEPFPHEMSNVDLGDVAGG